MIRICPADKKDQPRIRRLVYQAKINPMNLDWNRFVLAVTDDDELVGCGQVKPHRDGSQELASIAVAPGWRNQGIARSIIEYLLTAHPGDIYLTCRSRLGPFYEKFGFKRIPEDEMPPYFRRISQLARIFGRTGLIPEDLLVMKGSGKYSHKR